MTIRPIAACWTTISAVGRCFPRPSTAERPPWTALEQALAALNPIPLLLVDSQMPEMDGFTLVRRIREDGRFTLTTIMMLTSSEQHGDIARCRELGVARYLTKPITSEDLLTQILNALGSTQWPVPSGRFHSETPRTTDLLPVLDLV